MGRGSYIGGHTVIGPGSDWFARDGGKSKKRTRSPTPKQLILEYLRGVIRCELEGKDIPSPYKQVAPLIESQVVEKGGALAWAQAHSDYERLRTKEEKRQRLQGRTNGFGDFLV